MEDGAYAGYHPGDSREALAHVKDLQAKGAEWMLFPQTAFWWLEFYADLAECFRDAAGAIGESECLVVPISSALSDDQSLGVTR